MDLDAKNFEHGVDSFARLFRRRPWIAACLILWLVLPVGVPLLVNLFGAGKAKLELADTKDKLARTERERDSAQTQLAPFLAVANQRFGNAPADDRLQLVYEMVNTLRDLTNTIHSTARKTEDIERLADGRTVYGQMIMGNDHVVQEWIAKANSLLLTGDATNAYDFARRAIEAHESSRGYGSLEGTSPERYTDYYLIAADAAMVSGHLPQAVEWSTNAARLFVQGDANAESFIAMLGQLGRSEEARIVLRKLGNVGSLTNARLAAIAWDFYRITNSPPAAP